MAGSDHGDDHSPKPELHERSESSLSLNADDEDDFHDVDDAGTPTPGSPTLEPPKDEHDAAAEPARPEVTETADSTLATPHVVDPASSPAATAMSSSTSLPLRDPDLRVDPPEATADELVAFLRGQITDLTSQVTGLNAKLVKSYTARGELEDDLHEKEEREKELRRRVGELEADKERWTKEIEQGGWVEKDHIQGEMQRLMTKVVEETKSRETAVQGQRALETEVENLTSNLFAEANKMVAYERLARARAEEKTRSVEEAGTSMQALLAEVQVGLRDTVVKLEKRDAEVAELKRRLTALGEPVAEDPTDKEVDEGDAGGNIIFSNGEHLIPASPKLHAKDLSNAPIPSQFASPRLLASALPYHEFLNFINYLRQLRAATLSRPPESPAFPHPVLAARGLASDPPSAQALPPAQLLAPHLLLSTHLAQPFLKRCVEEDSDPALRLDLAPGLGFLSRRNVGTAIVDGTLLIEPLHAGSELPSDKCSLCGCSFAKWLAHSGMHRSKSAPGSGSNTTATNLNQTMRKVLGGGGWSISSTFSRSSSPAQAASPMSAPGSATRESFIFPDAPPHPSHHPLDPSLQVHVFRIKDTSTARYPVCPSYCLARLRAVCEFWTYVRVIERGLLLEEGFRFVQGRDGGGTPTGRGGLSRQASFDRSGSGHGTPLRENSTGPGLGVDGAEVQAKDFEAADTESEADKEHEKNEEPPKIVEPEPEVKEEKEQEAADSEKTDGDNDKEKKEGDDDKEKTEDKPAQSPTSPAFSRPQTPTLTQNANSSTGSLTKPGRPPRSSARNSPAIGVTPSPPASPRLASSPAAPSLPPRRAAAPPPPPPRHPATAAAPPPPTINEPAATSGPTVEGGDFVANAMGWEDRCWSEVVRLKESVFWARVAAVASDGSAVTSRGAKVWTQ
ncbi:hypothetical protein JCM1840_006272 [Sporobolomyces johnsonii]